MDEYDKKNEETSRKFSTLLQELNKCKTELQYWRSKTPALPPLCNNCGQVGFILKPTEELQTLNREAQSEGNFIVKKNYSSLLCEVLINLEIYLTKFIGKEFKVKEIIMRVLLFDLGFGLNAEHNLPLEPMELRTEASTSKEEDFWKVYVQKKEEKPQNRSSSQQVDAMKTAETIISPRGNKSKEEKEKISPTKYGSLSKSNRGKNLKRKVAEEDSSDPCSKKPKRVQKVRCASKRVKT